MRSKCSRAIWRPISLARDRIATSACTGPFRPVSGPVDGDIISMLILFRLSAIVSSNPMRGRGRGYGSLECHGREGLAALRGVSRMPWRRKGMGHSESGRALVEADRPHSSLTEFESCAVRQIPPISLYSTLWLLNLRLYVWQGSDRAKERRNGGVRRRKSSNRFRSSDCHKNTLRPGMAGMCPHSGRSTDT
ncbi:hypothetical protein FHW77_005436 [Agrobacterium sp. RC10-4-1]|nr:hypothetical protein [Agrobacterium sp. RC10-4-1]